MGLSVVKNICMHIEFANCYWLDGFLPRLAADNRGRDGIHLAAFASARMIGCGEADPGSIIEQHEFSAEIPITGKSSPAEPPYLHP